jgi:phage terminase small subunit
VSEEHYAPSVDRYLKATAREQLAHDALMSGEKVSPRLLETATAASRLAWSMGDALGLTPAGHARLKMLVAGATEAETTIGDLIEQGREIRTRAEQRIAAAGGNTLDGDQAVER